MCCCTGGKHLLDSFKHLFITGRRSCKGFPIPTAFWTSLSPKSINKKNFFEAPLYSFRWFAYFYLWGLIWTVILSTLISLTGEDNTITSIALYVIFYPSTLGDIALFSPERHLPLEVLLVLVLIHLQLLRRTYESFFITRFGPASHMHIGHFIFGLFFYTSLAPLALHQLKERQHTTLISLDYGFWMHCDWRHIVGIALFAWSSIHQYKCHLILASLRVKDKDGLYAIPNGDWFQYVGSPHYTAEILIYFSLFLCSGLRNYYLLLPLFSTAIMLILSARITHEWYREKFRDYPQERKIIFHWIY